MLFTNYQLFADAGTNVNATTHYVNAYTGETRDFTSDATSASGDRGMTSTMKTYYDTELLANSRAELFYAQFGKKQVLPANAGKTVEFRKWNEFGTAGKLEEGVIPAGENFGQTSILCPIDQYGKYTSITDVLEMHAIDNVILGATEEMGASMGLTEDRLVRNTLLEGMNVMYCDTVAVSGGAVSAAPTARGGLRFDGTYVNKLTPDTVNKAATWLKKQKAPRINGKYIAIIHPSIAYDLRSSAEWIEAHKYSAVTELFNGEIGELHGVRFVETTEAPIIGDAKPLNGETARYLSITGTATGTPGTVITESDGNYGVQAAAAVTVSETVTKDLVGRKVVISKSSAYSGDGIVTGITTVAGESGSTKTVYIDGTFSAANGDFLLPGEGGFEVKGDDETKVNVYATIFLGKDGYALIDPEGAGSEMIIKDKSVVGGPLNQFSTVGYKFSAGSKILYPGRVLRVESTSTYSALDDANF